MIDETLQLWLDQALATCRQRWLSSLAAVASITAATLVITIPAASAQATLVIVGAITGLAVVAVAASGSHVGSMVIALVAVAWVVLIDDVATPRAVAVAGCIYVFHALLALMAATRHTTPLDRRLLVRWTARSAVVVGATIMVWLAVVALEGQSVTGGANMTSFGVLAIAISVVGTRRQILRSHTVRR